MKVICDRSALLDAINTVSGVVPSRTPRQHLTCVSLTAEKSGDAGSLVLAATDAEISLRLRVDRVDVAEPGQMLIPADKLRQIVSAEDADATLTLESEGDACHIRGQDAHFMVLGLPPSEFPPVPDFQSIAQSAQAVFSHEAGSIQSLIARTIFATARENSRYAINGVLLTRDGKTLRLVATDGRRLAMSTTSLTGTPKDAPTISCIIPTKALVVLSKLADDPEESIEIAISDNQAVFAFGDAGDPRATLASNLIEGTFPPFEDVIPKDQDKKVIFDRDVMASAVRRAALLTNEESRGVRLAFTAKDKKLEISSRSPENGEAQITVELADYSGEDIEIGFNPAFITDALKVIDDPRVTMELKAPNRPGIIRSGNDFVYVVMPVNLT